MNWLTYLPHVLGALSLGAGALVMLACGAMLLPAKGFS